MAVATPSAEHGSGYESSTGGLPSPAWRMPLPVSALGVEWNAGRPAYGPFDPYDVPCT